MFSLMALVAPFAVAAVAASTTSNTAVAAPQTPDLCIGTGIDTLPDNDAIGSGGCEYAAWDAPVLDADVCWNGSFAALKGTAPCLEGAYAYHVKHGEVLDPVTSLVVGYAPLINTCDVVDCKPKFQPNPLGDGTACCDSEGNCYSPNENGLCTVGTITWCKEIEEHNNGTVTCFE